MKLPFFGGRYSRGCWRFRNNVQAARLSPHSKEDQRRWGFRFLHGQMVWPCYLGLPLGSGCVVCMGGISFHQWGSLCITRRSTGPCAKSRARPVTLSVGRHQKVVHEATFLGDFYDAVKRLWQEAFSEWAPLLAEPRFIPKKFEMTSLPLPVFPY